MSDLQRVRNSPGRMREDARESHEEKGISLRTRGDKGGCGFLDPRCRREVDRIGALPTVLRTHPTPATPGSPPSGGRPPEVLSLKSAVLPSTSCGSSERCQREALKGGTGITTDGKGQRERRNEKRKSGKGVAEGEAGGSGPEEGEAPEPKRDGECSARAAQR